MKNMRAIIFFIIHRILKISPTGQTTVVVLLIMVVVLTVGLSITARSITDLRISTQTELSNRAFSAAEAGIEEALKTGLPSLVGSGDSAVLMNAKYQYRVEAVGGSSYAPSKQVVQDDVVQLKLDRSGLASPYDGINIYWSKEGEDCDVVNGNPASLEVSIIHGDGPYEMIKRAYALKNRGDNFEQIIAGSYRIGGSGPSYCGKITAFADFDFLDIDDPQVMRIRPLYNSVSVAVEAQPIGRELPVQSFRVKSEGEAGGVKRTVEVTQSVPVLPAIFDYVLYSGAGLSK